MAEERVACTAKQALVCKDYRWAMLDIKIVVLVNNHRLTKKVQKQLVKIKKEKKYYVLYMYF